MIVITINITNELKDKYQSFINNGYTTKQVANEMMVPWSTIKGHFRKLGLKTIHKREPLKIQKCQLETYIGQNYSTHKMARELNCSQCVIRYWLNIYGLKTNPQWTILRTKIKKEIEEGYKTCSQCNQKKTLTNENFYLKKNGKFHYWCKRCNNRISLKKQTERKQKCVDYKGGKCMICGYNKYIGALDFHHIDPTKKEFNISNLRTYSWEMLKVELDKCICVCKNCHAETHAGLHEMVGPVGLEPTLVVL